MSSRKLLKICELVVARDGIEPPTPAFSGLRSSVRVAGPALALSGHMIIELRR